MKYSQALVLLGHNLHNIFEVNMDATQCVMGEVLMKGGKPICYHSKIFYGKLLNYPTYENNSMPRFELLRNRNTI